MCKRIPDSKQITLDGQLNNAIWLNATDWCNDGEYIRSDVAGRVYTKREATMIVMGIKITKLIDFITDE